MREIPLTRGMVAIVDDEDYERISAHKWNYSVAKCSKMGYAARTAVPERVTVFMHHEVFAPPDGMDTDHINGNKLDNRRANLRACTRSQNIANVGMRSTNTSGFKGVHFSKEHKKYQAHICKGKKKMFLGYHKTAEEAARAYDMAAKKIFGEFAYPNFSDAELQSITR